MPFRVTKIRTAVKAVKLNLGITKAISKKKPKAYKPFDFFYSRSIFRLLVKFYKEEFYNQF